MEFLEQLRVLGVYKPEMDILDVGCRTGWRFQKLDKPGRNYDGVDIIDILDFSIDRSRIRFFKESLTEFIPDKQYDLIFARNVFFFSEDQIAQVEKYFKYLKVGGIMCVTFMLDNDPHVGQRTDEVSTWYGVSHAELNNFVETKEILWKDEFEGETTSMTERKSLWHVQFFILKK